MIEDISTPRISVLCVSVVA